MQSPEDPVAQKERAHEKEREHSTPRAAEEPQPTMLRAGTCHFSHILPSITLGEQPPKRLLAVLGVQNCFQIGSMKYDWIAGTEALLYWEASGTPRMIEPLVLAYKCTLHTLLAEALMA
jgi:hypothetical protein